MEVMPSRDTIFVCILEYGFVCAGLTPVGASHVLAGAIGSIKSPLKLLPLFKRDFFERFKIINSL